jgi:hypothetical protein
MKPRRLVMRRSDIAIACGVVAAACISTISAGQAGPDWTTTKDRTGVCQISVPKNWGQSVTLIARPGAVRTLKPDVQAMYSQRMLENTQKRVFYVLKSNDKAHVAYMVDVPGEGYHCTAQLVVQPDYSENEVKEIVTTFTAKKP